MASPVAISDLFSGQIAMKRASIYQGQRRIMFKRRRGWNGTVCSGSQGRLCTLIWGTCISSVVPKLFGLRQSLRPILSLLCVVFCNRPSLPLATNTRSHLPPPSPRSQRSHASVLALLPTSWDHKSFCVVLSKAGVILQEAVYSHY